MKSGARTVFQAIGILPLRINVRRLIGGDCLAWMRDKKRIDESANQRKNTFISLGEVGFVDSLIRNSFNLRECDYDC